MGKWQRSRNLKSVAGCVLLSLVWGLCPAWAADDPFQPSEERAILEAVEELQAARDEIGTLKAALAKDAALVDALRVQIAALERLSATQERMLGVAEKLGGLQDRAVQTYRDLAAASDLRAERAEARAERAEKVGKWAGPLGALLGVGLTAALAVFLR